MKKKKAVWSKKYKVISDISSCMFKTMITSLEEALYFTGPQRSLDFTHVCGASNTCFSVVIRGLSFGLDKNGQARCPARVICFTGLHKTLKVKGEWSVITNNGWLRIQKS